MILRKTALATAVVCASIAATAANYLGRTNIGLTAGYGDFIGGDLDGLYEDGYGLAGISLNWAVLENLTLSVFANGGGADIDSSYYGLRDVDIEVSDYDVGIGAIVHLAPNEAIDPFFGGTVRYSRSEITIDYWEELRDDRYGWSGYWDHFEDDDSTCIFSAIAGAEFNISEQVSLVAAAQYFVNTDDSDYNDWVFSGDLYYFAESMPLFFGVGCSYALDDEFLSGRVSFGIYF